MDEKHQQLINIFYPNLFEEINRINSNNSNGLLNIDKNSENLSNRNNNDD